MRLKAIKSIVFMGLGALLLASACNDNFNGSLGLDELRQFNYRLECSPDDALCELGLVREYESTRDDAGLGWPEAVAVGSNNYPKACSGRRGCVGVESLRTPLIQTIFQSPSCQDDCEDLSDISCDLECVGFAPIRQGHMAFFLSGLDDFNERVLVSLNHISFESIESVIFYTRIVQREARILREEPGFGGPLEMQVREGIQVCAIPVSGSGQWLAGRLRFEWSQSANNLLKLTPSGSCVFLRAGEDTGSTNLSVHLPSVNATLPVAVRSGQ